MKPPNRTCEYCGLAFYVKPSQDGKACCTDHARKLATKRFIERAEQHLGEPLKAGIERRLSAGVSTQSIALACGISRQGLYRLMRHLSIEGRTPSEAVRLQWVDNEIRRASWGSTISEWKRKHPQEALEHSLIGNLSLQNTSPTSIEWLMFDALSSAGIPFEFQYVIGDKFLCDFAFPYAMLVVECDGTYWHSTAKQRARDASKDAYLQACGYSVLRFSDKQIERDVFACVRAIQSLLPSFHNG